MFFGATGGGLGASKMSFRTSGLSTFVLNKAYPAHKQLAGPASHGDDAITDDTSPTNKPQQAKPSRWSFWKKKDQPEVSNAVSGIGVSTASSAAPSDTGLALCIWYAVLQSCITTRRCVIKVLSPAREAVICVPYVHIVGWQREWPSKQ
jgi:hypothetical protein